MTRGSIVLVMRDGLRTQVDHVQAMLDLAVEIHLVTADTTSPDDPRFASIVRLPADAGLEEFAAAAHEAGRRHGASAVITFYEEDLEITETANERLGTVWASAEQARICRDKLRQRTFLAEHGIPSVWFHPVRELEPAVEAAVAHGLPLIVKPTRGATSDCVELVAEPERLRASLQSIRTMIEERRGFYHFDFPETWALLEDYLPGEEVTLDGVVLDGQFFLGGVHNKRHSPGPFFDEDLYTLPFDSPEREPELEAIASAIVKGLGVRHCLFNAELRLDADGVYRVIEFSIRMSGGHPYRHIKDVYGIDLVRLFVRVACGEPAELVLEQENPRRPPRVATCAKVIYANGRVVRNSVGEAMRSPFFRAYYAVAKPGDDVVAGPGGFDYTGLLSVWVPWRPGQSPEVVHAVAHELAAKLDVEVQA